MIPVYQVTVPEYRFKKVTTPGPLVDYDWGGFVSQIPKGYWDARPDFEKIGGKLDRAIKKHFLGKKVAVRVLGSDEHKGKSVDDVVKIIKSLGHDRYDPHRKGDRYENIHNKPIEIFALEFAVRQDKDYMKQFVESFYVWPISDDRGPIKVDIMIIYDRSKLKAVHHRYKGRENELKKDGFVFRDKDNKPDAILGIIKIL